MLRWTRPPALAVVASISILAAACGDDDDGGERREPTPDADIAQFFEDAVGAWNESDAEGFTSLFTDEALAQFVEDPRLNRAEAEEAVGGFIGEDEVTIREIRSREVTEESAEAELESSTGIVVNVERFDLVRVPGNWRVAGYERLPAQIPEGAAPVEVVGREFEFEYDPDAIEDGNIAFDFSNEGEQSHELVLARVNERFTIDDALNAAEGEEPPNVEQFLGGTFAPPGESGTLVFTEALEPGRYVMVCFIPDESQGEDGPPHAALGMHSEFAIPD